MAWAAMAWAAMAWAAMAWALWVVDSVQGVAAWSRTPWGVADQHGDGCGTYARQSSPTLANN